MLKKLIKIVPSAVACTVLSLAAVAGENWNDPNFVAGAKAEFSGEGANVPEGYVPPIIGNGSIVTSVDFLAQIRLVFPRGRLGGQAFEHSEYVADYDGAF